jgi:hypothetical protein
MLRSCDTLVLGLPTVCCNFAVSCPQALFFWHVSSITKEHIFHSDNTFFIYIFRFVISYTQALCRISDLSCLDRIPTVPVDTVKSVQLIALMLPPNPFRGCVFIGAKRKMADCCPLSAWPALAPPEDYTPKGTEVKLEDLMVRHSESTCS